VSEGEWVEIVRSIASREPHALHALYQRAHRIVFTLIMRITNDGETAEEVTMDVFHDVWRRAATYDAAGGTVVGWIMNQARSRAIDRLRFEQRKKRVSRSAGRARPVVESFVSWPTDVLRPSASVWDRLAERVSAEGAAPVLPALDRWVEPDWKNVAPGIAVEMLATDADRSRVSMLVRLDPGTDYPPHTHAGLEELHLLQGELWIDNRKLRPGDYSRAHGGTFDSRVWSETGCTCVLITSPRDVLG
jgi:RNA polymerase sigma factor (sigma-70 family)